jgi:uncharacterized SAM-binding protein YcdF (DUF218 family)
MAFVDVFLSPLGFGLLLALLLWLSRRRLPCGMLRAGIGVEIVCLFLTTPVGANLLTSWQERRATLAECGSPAPSTIVVLSGGMRRDAENPGDFGVLNVATLQRTLTGAGLALRTPGATLVFSGGARVGGESNVAQAEIMADVARKLGVPAASIRTEDASTTTWENARDVRALDPELPARIALVTSALHMPRALIAFRAAGFDPCAYPSDYRFAPFDGPADLLPSAGAIANADATLHEWVGEIAYRLRAAH